MTSSPRIPKAEINGVYGNLVKIFSRRMLGEVPEPAEVMWHNRDVLKSIYGLGRKADKWNECDKNLKSFAHMAVASLVGCSFCLDLGYFMAHNEKLDEAKASEVPRWRQSDAFTPLETRRAGVRRVYEPNATDGHRCAVCPAARRARAGGNGGAHRMDRAGEPLRAVEHGDRHRVAGLLEGV